MDKIKDLLNTNPQSAVLDDKKIGRRPGQEEGVTFSLVLIHGSQLTNLHVDAVLNYTHFLFRFTSHQNILKTQV